MLFLIRKFLILINLKKKLNLLIMKFEDGFWIWGGFVFLMYYLQILILCGFSFFELLQSSSFLWIYFLHLYRSQLLIFSCRGYLWNGKAIYHFRHCFLELCPRVFLFFTLLPRNIRWKFNLNYHLGS